jgi:hypothetical protein
MTVRNDRSDLPPLPQPATVEPPGAFSSENALSTRSQSMLILPERTQYQIRAASFPIVRAPGSFFLIAGRTRALPERTHQPARAVPERTHSGTFRAPVPSPNRGTGVPRTNLACVSSAYVPARSPDHPSRDLPERTRHQFRRVPFGIVRAPGSFFPNATSLRSLPEGTRRPARTSPNEPGRVRFARPGRPPTPTGPLPERIGHAPQKWHPSP